MKKMQLFLLAAMLVAVGSAFTTAPKTKLDPLYKAIYSGGGFSWALVSGTEGTCDTNPSDFCKARFASTPTDNQIPTAEELVMKGDYVEP